MARAIPPTVDQARTGRGMSFLRMVFGANVGPEPAAHPSPAPAPPPPSKHAKADEDGLPEVLTLRRWDYRAGADPDSEGYGFAHPTGRFLGPQSLPPRRRGPARSRTSPVGGMMSVPHVHPMTVIGTPEPPPVASPPTTGSGDHGARRGRCDRCRGRTWSVGGRDALRGGNTARGPKPTRTSRVDLRERLVTGSKRIQRALDNRASALLSDVGSDRAPVQLQRLLAADDLGRAVGGDPAVVDADRRHRRHDEHACPRLASRLRTLRVPHPEPMRNRWPSKANPTGTVRGDPSGLAVARTASRGNPRMRCARSDSPERARKAGCVPMPAPCGGSERPGA